MSKIKRILFTTPYPEGERTEFIEVGLKYWDMGVCVAIHKNSNDGSYFADFDTKQHYTINDVKRILTSDE